MGPIFDSLFLKIHYYHFGSLSKLNLHFHASGEIKAQKFVKLSVVSVEIKSSFKVRLCWKKGKQDIWKDFRNLEENITAMRNHS